MSAQALSSCVLGFLSNRRGRKEPDPEPCMLHRRFLLFQPPRSSVAQRQRGSLHGGFIAVAAIVERNGVGLGLLHIRVIHIVGAIVVDREGHSVAVDALFAQLCEAVAAKTGYRWNDNLICRRVIVFAL